MAQTFDPAHVMLSDTIGKEIADEGFTQAFLERFVQTSLLMKLGSPVNMASRMIRTSAGLGELSNAYFVGEGEKIGTAGFEATDYVLEARKIAVILPVTEEFLQYTWAQYFEEVVPAIVDKFNKMIDGAAFLGLHGNPFGANVLASATTAGNVITGPLDRAKLIELEAVTETDPTAIVGHRSINTTVRGIYDATTNQYIYDKGTNSIDGIAYHELKIAKGETYPAGTLFAGDFNGLKYGVPNGTQLRLKVADQATLSKVQNTAPDTGDVNLFEQDMQALRAVFEIAVAIPVNEAFAVVQSGE